MDGIGVDDVLSGDACTERDDAEVLLEEAEGDAEDDAEDGAAAADEPAFEGEDVFNQRIRGSEIAQGGDFGGFIDHQHGEGADDVEGGDEQDEDDEEVGDPLLDLHDAVGVGLLLVLRENTQV